MMDAFSPPRTPPGWPIRRADVRTIAEAGTRAATGELLHPTVSSFLTYYPQPELVSESIRRSRMRSATLVRSPKRREDRDRGQGSGPPAIDFVVHVGPVSQCEVGHLGELTHDRSREEPFARCLAERSRRA